MYRIIILAGTIVIGRSVSDGSLSIGWAIIIGIIILIIATILDEFIKNIGGNRHE